MEEVKLYVSADIVSGNNMKEPAPPIHNNENITEIYDIPYVSSSPHITIPNTAPTNLIKTLNQTAMTDVMNQNMMMNINKKTTPSVSTRHTNLSIPIPIPSSGAGAATQSIIEHPVYPNAEHLPEKNIPRSRNSRQTHRIRSTVSKVIIDDEDRDTAIDYDDDDPEIKKTKLSLFHFAKDITFNLIFIIPFLRTKLSSILKEPTLAINQIERVFDEFKDLLNREQLESIKKYVCEDGVRDKLNFILESGFNKILSDGKIDINDAPQFNQLVYFIIKSFNNMNHGKVFRFYVSREHVMLLLHFILKSVFTLTLKGEEEQMAIGLLDTSFKLVQIEVLPLISKRWYHKFRVCHAVKEIEELIE